jgi:ketopantoate reductase
MDLAERGERLARGEHRDVIRTRGLEVREPEGAWTARVGATDDPAELLPADLAIVAVKSYSLEEVAPVVRRLAESGSNVIPLLNGVEAFESLAALGVPPDRMLAGAVISVEKTAPSDHAEEPLPERPSSGSAAGDRRARRRWRRCSARRERTPVSRRTSRSTSGGSSSF